MNGPETDILLTMTARAPIAHGSFSDVDTGNATMLRREPIVSLPGHPRVPCLSGNSLRGQLRRHVMRDIFERCGLSRDSFTLDARQWDRLYAALANGGHLDGSEARVRIDARRQLRASLPPLSCFGAALYSYMLEGRFEQGFAWPVCDETIACGWFDGPSPGRAEDLLTDTSIARHVDRDYHAPETSGVTPMPTSIEAFAPGARLVSRITFRRGATEVERSVVAYGLSMIRGVGAKSGAGFGVVDLDVAGGDAAPYRAWLDENKDAATHALRELAERLGQRPEKKRGKGKGNAKRDAAA